VYFQTGPREVEVNTIAAQSSIYSEIFLFYFATLDLIHISFTACLLIISNRFIWLRFALFCKLYHAKHLCAPGPQLYNHGIEHSFAERNISVFEWWGPDKREVEKEEITGQKRIGEQVKAKAYYIHNGTEAGRRLSRPRVDGLSFFGRTPFLPSYTPALFPPPPVQPIRADPLTLFQVPFHSFSHDFLFCYWPPSILVAYFQLFQPRSVTVFGFLPLFFSAPLLLLLVPSSSSFFFSFSHLHTRALSLLSSHLFSFVSSFYASVRHLLVFLIWNVNRTGCPWFRP